MHDADDPALAGIEHRLAEIHHRLGDWPAAAAHLDAALDLAGDDPVLRARVEADLAFVAYRRGDAGARKLANTALPPRQVGRGRGGRKRKRPRARLQRRRRARRRGR